MLISGKDNKNIKLYKKLCADKKARNEYGMFVIEGMRICIDTAREAQNGKVEIVALFVTQEALEKYSSLLPVEVFDFVDDDKKFYITPEISDKMSDEGNSQGVFIIAKKLDREFSAQIIDSNGKYLVLDNVQDPGNLGTLLRTADAVGVSGVVLTNNCCDLYNPKVVRSAMGSMPRLEMYISNDFYTVADAFAKRGVATAATIVRDGTSITEYDFSKACAVVIGNEGRGLPIEHSDYCSDRITIRMNGHIESLNAATAGTIFLWEMLRER